MRYGAAILFYATAAFAQHVTTAEQRQAALTLRRIMAARRQAQDLLDVGAYQRGANPLVDAAVDGEADIEAFLTQGIDEGTSAAVAWNHLFQLVAGMAVI